MRRLCRLGLISLGLVAVLGGSLITWLALRPVVPVTVTVRNGSQKAIALIRVEHERGVETTGSLERGEARKIQFVAGGETSYTLRVRFVDGSEVSANPQYAESGYEFVQTITESEVKTDDVSLPRY